MEGSDAHPDPIGEELAAWGKVALIETHGRITGRSAIVAVGFVEEFDGSVLVAAGAEDADWALNLRHDHECSVTIGERKAQYDAAEIDGAQRSDAIGELILKYGTPAERLGRGPAFKLSPSK